MSNVQHGDERAERRLGVLARTLSRSSEGIDHLTYTDAEVATERLAALMLDEVGRQRLESSYYIPIPRGGLIVLGMLSYVLRLRPDQLPPSDRAERPVVLIDDVALTGARVREWLDRTASDDVVVAHLASQPELRRRIGSDPRVRNCVSSVDLQSLLDELPDAKRAKVAAHWNKQLDDRRYWFGLAKPLNFDWCEPDHMIWHESDQSFERGWHLVSPERCLKARSDLGPPSPDRARRQMRFPDKIAYGRFDDHLLICRLDTLEITRLDAVAATMWGALGTLGDVGAAAAHLRSEYDVDDDVLLTDLIELAERFVATGLLSSVTLAPS